MVEGGRAESTTDSLTESVRTVRDTHTPGLVIESITSTQRRLSDAHSWILNQRSTRNALSPLRLCPARVRDPEDERGSDINLSKCNH